VFIINIDSSLIARAYLPARGPLPAFTLELSVDSLGSLSLPPGEYDVATGLPLSFAAALRNSSLIAAPVAGTITIASSSSTAMSGSLDLEFEYIQFPETQPAPFTLQGRFRFSDADAVPAP
jgi:hypothetical protein